MSGGSLNYFCYELEDHVGDFADCELDDLVKDMAKLFKAREWAKSGDTSMGDWNEARDMFKAKWFTVGGRRDRIEQYLQDFTDEMRRAFGISTKYCENCKYWTQSQMERYGQCEFDAHCLSHRKESCEKWEEKE